MSQAHVEVSGNGYHLETRVLPVDERNIGSVDVLPKGDDILDEIKITLDPGTPDADNLRFAAEQLRTSNIPVAFPTETVYGLGADATRSDAVTGIYRAKQRPADNPLIVHFASLRQLRELLRPSLNIEAAHVNGHDANGGPKDPIPKIYKPVISKFWPGPLTIILPNPPNSPLAPEVTAGLNTFGARIPRHILALALIQHSGRPIAAPSANASTKPSPTAAEHVAHDLNGRIETIIDGGPCDVGVESTVVDGLSDPPLVLRPGGISIEQLRSCPGWENTQIGYKNAAENGDRPKAPGMKYRHYSPKASVVLYETGVTPPSWLDVFALVGSNRRIGVITTKTWQVHTSLERDPISERAKQSTSMNGLQSSKHRVGFAGMINERNSKHHRAANVEDRYIESNGSILHLLEIALSGDTDDVARGIFSALRELDKADVDAIIVEGIDENEGDTAAAVMNRLRKAAQVETSE